MKKAFIGSSLEAAHVMYVHDAQRERTLLVQRAWLQGYPLPSLSRPNWITRGAFLLALSSGASTLPFIIPHLTPTLT